MGIVYYVACRDCRVVRDLDKFYAAKPAKTRAEATDIMEDIEGRYAFPAALLASFMAEHEGHNCTMLTEMHIGFYDEIFNPDSPYKEESAQFWMPNEGEKDSA